MMKTIKRFVHSFLDVFRVCLGILAFIMIVAIMLNVFNVEVALIHSIANWICKTMGNLFDWLATLV